MSKITNLILFMVLFQTVYSDENCPNYGTCCTSRPEPSCSNPCLSDCVCSSLGGNMPECCGSSGWTESCVQKLSDLLLDMNNTCIQAKIPSCSSTSTCIQSCPTEPVIAYDEASFSTTKSNSNQDESPQPASKKKHLSIPVIAGIAIGVLVVLIVSSLLVLFVLIRRHERRSQAGQSKDKSRRKTDLERAVELTSGEFIEDVSGDDESGSNSEGESDRDRPSPPAIIVAASAYQVVDHTKEVKQNLISAAAQEEEENYSSNSSSLGSESSSESGTDYGTITE